MTPTSRRRLYIMPPRSRRWRAPDGPLAVAAWKCPLSTQGKHFASHDSFDSPKEKNTLGVPNRSGGRDMILRRWRRAAVFGGLALTLSLAWGTVASTTIAHGGGLNAEGCHNNRKTGGYHCHRGGSSTRASSSRTYGVASSGRSGAFANCTAARAAGAAPVRVGTAGYGSHLDRDGDGIGCE